jgi:hypothetical protein
MAALALFGLMAAFAPVAQAHPNLTSKCANCHSLDSAVLVTPTLVSSTAAASTYSVAVNNPYGTNGWAVFNGSSKLAGAAGNGSTFTVANGGTYTVYGVSGDNNGTEGYDSAVVSPVAPAGDTVAPTTTSDVKATYADSATIKLTATDNAGGSGVAHTYYKLDGGAQTEATTINVTAPGAHSLAFWSVDTAGNVETQKTASFTITVTPPADTTAPTTVSDAKATYADSASIKLTATDNMGGSGVAHTYYILDSSLQAEGTTIGVTTPGAHTITFWSVDVAGNAEAHKTASFTITVTPPADTTAPTTVSDAKATYADSASIKLTATDNAGGSGVAHTYYTVDAGAQTEGTTIAVTAPGPHTIAFWSVDTAGNAEVHKTASFTITVTPPPVVDTTAPLTISDVKATYVGSASIKLTATDNVGGTGVAHTYYILDGAAQAAGTTIVSSVVGTHTLEFWSVDVAGNIEAPHTTATFEVTAAPVPPTPTGYTVRVRISGEFEHGTVIATLTSRADGTTYAGVVSRRGVVTFIGVPAGVYDLRVAGRHEGFRTRTITVGPSNGHED